LSPSEIAVERKVKVRFQNTAYYYEQLEMKRKELEKNKNTAVVEEVVLSVPISPVVPKRNTRQTSKQSGKKVILHQ